MFRSTFVSAHSIYFIKQSKVCLINFAFEKLSLQQKEQAVWTSKTRYQVKEFSILCVGRCKPLGSLISSLLTHLGSTGPALFPCTPCFFHSPNSSAVTTRVAASSGLHLWEPSFTFGGQKSLMAVTFLVYRYAGDIFISL